MNPLSSILPRPHAVLKHIVTATGYGFLLSKDGLAKDLESMGKERPGSTTKLMLKFENILQKRLLEDIGEHWTAVFFTMWGREQDLPAALRLIALSVDTTTVDQSVGKSAISKLLTVPALSEAFRQFVKQFPGMDETLWWKSPLAAWVGHAAKQTGLPEKVVLERLSVKPSQPFKGGQDSFLDSRSMHRWIAGSVQPSLKAPYIETVKRVLDKCPNSISMSQTHQLAGWLVVAMGYQSLKPEFRALVETEYSSGKSATWKISKVIDGLRGLKHDQSAINDLEMFARLIRGFPEILSAIGDDKEKHNEFLQGVRSALDQIEHPLREKRQMAQDWLTAWFAAMSEDHVEAQRLFRSAVDQGRWCAGPYQELMTSDALLHAVGVGQVVAAKHYWDELCLLGVNGWPPAVPELDDAEFRRLAIAFEARFPPLKAKERVPPAMEIVLMDEPFTLTPEQIKNPNRKRTFAEGRTRRTPLMDAVDQGTADDVRQLLASGNADVNDFIKESGENALIHSVRRCGKRKAGSWEILDLLLDANPSSETINRCVSSRRETMLGLAIDMGAADIVSRLIDLGASLEVRCDQSPSALVHALSFFYMLTTEGLEMQTGMWMSGEDGGDVYAAKAGAATKAETARERHAQAASVLMNDRHMSILEEIRRDMSPSLESVREVILMLLSRGADPNRRYHMPHDAANEWTPTLLAAQVGDLAVFRELVENGGDPDLTLVPPSSAMNRHDALWIAAGYNRNLIVNYLRARG